MKPINETLKMLKQILEDENCHKMNKSTVKGYFAELFIKAKLEEEIKGTADTEIIHRGNQSGFDLEIGKKIKIDVKYSTIKDNVFEDWSWALLLPSKNRGISCTHFVCVGVNKEFHPIKICVINASDIEKFPTPEKGRFNITHSFSLPQDHNPWPQGKYFDDCQNLVMQGKVKVLEKEQRLLDLLVC